MSYILDALKRAESERSRGAVPGVHAQPQSPVSPAVPGRGPAVWVAAVLVALAVGGASVLWLAGRRATPAPAPVVAAVVAVAEPTPPVPVPVPSPPAAPVAERPAAVLPPIPAIPAIAAMPVVPLASVPAPPPVQPPKALAAANPSAGSHRFSTLAELPDSVRQQLPALAISGGTYSENPLYRMVIVNGQVLHEGDTAAPGVVLDTIRPKDVVLRAQGYRFAMKY